MAFDRHGRLYVAEALAGASGIYRVESNGSAVRVLAGGAIVGLAFDPIDESLVVVSNDTAYRTTLSVASSVSSREEKPLS